MFHKERCCDLRVNEGHGLTLLWRWAGLPLRHRREPAGQANEYYDDLRKMREAKFAMKLQGYGWPRRSSRRTDERLISMVSLFAHVCGLRPQVIGPVLGKVLQPKGRLR